MVVRHLRTRGAMRIENRFHAKDAIAWPFCEIAAALSVLVGTAYLKNGQAGLPGRAPPIIAYPNQAARGGARCRSHAQENGSIGSVWLLMDAYLIDLPMIDRRASRRPSFEQQ